jgi:hypothetical protein
MYFSALCWLDPFCGSAQNPRTAGSWDVDFGHGASLVNLALAAVDHFNRFLGLGPANVKREPLAQAAPRSLSDAAQLPALLGRRDASPVKLVDENPDWNDGNDVLRCGCA